MSDNTGYPTEDLEFDWSRASGKARDRAKAPSDSATRHASSERTAAAGSARREASETSFPASGRRDGSRASSGRRERQAGVRARQAARPRRTSGTAQTKTKGKKSGFVRFVQVVALLVLVVLIIAGVALGVAYAQLSKQLPDPTQAAKGRDQTSRVLDRNGRLLTKLHAEQDRTDVQLASMPKELKNAVISIEDERYYEHNGVDPIGIARALWTDLREGTTAQGGSTITQQYVKQAFFTPEKTAKRKMMEAMLAYQVEKRFSKDQILEMYLNTIYFGHGAYGVQAASQAYFGKVVSKLSLPEAAMLAGVIRSPGHYSPYEDPDSAKARRDLVLAKMLQLGYIDRAARDAAAASPVKVAGLKQRSTRAPYFVEYVRRQLIDEYGADAVYRGGLVVRTTIDMRMQAAAEKSVREHLDKPDDPWASLVAIDPATGQILAMVGGKGGKNQYNIATQGHRQPGSAFKPFVLATALEEGVSPEKPYESSSMKLRIPGGQTWSVSGHGKGPLRLRKATEQSVNSVFAQLILELGADKVAGMARKMGITTTLTPVPAIALGGLKEGVTPLEMASAYSTLAGQGKHMDYYSISKVTDGTGKVLLNRRPKGKQVLDPAAAYLETDILTGVIKRGTGKDAAIGRPAAGKTGTTQEYRDAWFVGYTPDLVAAVWVGYPTEQKEMTSVHGIKVTGGSFPARIWSQFMRDALEGSPERKFERPKGLTSVTICELEGLKANEFCPKKVQGLFLSKNLPGPCDVHLAPQEIAVPNLVGMTKEAAIAALRKLQFLFKILEQEVAGVPAGYVASQNPPGGSRATTSTVISVVVSKGGSSPSMPPTAAFKWVPASPSARKTVTFDGTASRDDGKIVSWVWEFGDGTGGNGAVVTHTFGAPGTYDVTLWVTDDHGQASSISQKVMVK